MNVLEKAQIANNKAIMPRRDRENAFLSRMRKWGRKTAWLQNCDSWYLDEQGHVTIWTSTSDDFIDHLSREPDLAKYEAAI